MNNDGRQHIGYNLEVLLPVVATLSAQYTMNESSSITYDKAKQLMGAVIYCLNERTESEELTTLQDPNEQIEEAYKRGFAMVQNKVTDAKITYESILGDFDAYGNRNYAETVMKALLGFFQRYDAKFDPANHIITMDYPTIIPIRDEQGIDAIHLYLQYIEIEQKFLQCFPSDYVREVLSHYHSDYENLYVNIAAILYRHLLGHMLIQKRFEHLSTSETSYERIHLKLLNKSKEEIQRLLRDCTIALVDSIYASDADLYNYLIGDINDFGVELMNGMDNGSLQTLLYI